MMHGTQLNERRADMALFAAQRIRPCYQHRPARPGPALLFVINLKTKKKKENILVRLFAHYVSGARHVLMGVLRGKLVSQTLPGFSALKKRKHDRRAKMISLKRR